jgi:predicted Zn-dependent protease
MRISRAVIGAQVEGSCYSLEGQPKSLRMRIIPVLMGMSLLAFLPSGCAVNPVSGKSEIVLISTEEERKLGAQEAVKVEKTMGLVDDPKIMAYIKTVGRRLAEHSPRQDVDYTFQIVDMEVPNAFALPGGYVYVSRGLLVLVNSEDELAGVMGHEIGHVAGRHAVQRLTRVAATSPLRIATGIVGGAVSIVAPGVGTAIADAGQVASTLVIAPYSRDQEREADRIGQEIAASAGWNPEGLASLLKSMGRAEKLHSGEERQSSFFDTHPATGERVAKTTERATQLSASPARPIAKNRAALMAKFNGLLVGNNPAKGVFIKDDFIQPTLGFYMRFPPAWKKHNTNEVVIAQAPGEKGLVLLEVSGKGEDPVAVVRQLEQKLDANLLENASRTQINGLPAIQLTRKAKTSEGVLGVLFTWIAHKGVVYQITGLSPSDSFDSYLGVFKETVASFRPLSGEDWLKIKEARLRVVKARNGETLEELGKRVNSVWSLAEIAVTNGLPQKGRLSGGQLIKVAILQPYKPQAFGF